MTNFGTFSRSVPLDVVLLIIEIAAAPEFHSKRDPYACGRSMCRVSRTVRRAALRSMLHTVVLAREGSVCKFATALRLQKTFKKTNRPLFIDYTLHVSKIWITQYFEPPPPCVPSARQSFHLATQPSDEDDLLPLLAPVILGASSLLFDESSMSLLCDCLTWVWRHRATPSLQSLSLPCTQKLALHGCFSRWLPFTSNQEGSAFLASIRSLAVLPEVTADEDHSEHSWDDVSWAIRGIPLQSFRGLRKLVVPLVPFPLSEGAYVNGCDANIKVLTMEAPTTGSKPETRQWVDDAIAAHLEGRTTEFTLASPHLDGFGWQQCWSDHLMDD